MIIWLSGEMFWDVFLVMVFIRVLIIMGMFSEIDLIVIVMSLSLIRSVSFIRI